MGLCMMIICLLPRQSFSQNLVTADSLDTSLYTIEDSSYGELILHDIGSYTVVSQEGVLTSRYEYQKRWKILDKKGESFQETITFDPGVSAEELIELKVTTYTPIGEGTYEAEEISPATFEKEVSSIAYTLKHLIKDPTPGMIIDYEYVIVSPDLHFPRPWKFQHFVPCRLSEYTTAVPRKFSYWSTLNRSYFPIETKEEFYNIPNSGAISYYDPLIPGIDLSLGEGEIIYDKRTFYSVNVPAMENEPYLPSLEDYIPKLSMQIKENFSPGRRGQKKFILDWENFNERFMQSENFGAYLEPISSLEVTAKKLTFKAKNNRERIKILYDFVRDNIEWDGTYTLFPSDLEYAMEVRKGTNSDVNFLLLSMLKSLKIEAYPVLISTRDHGQISPFYPLVKQFNHVLVVVNLGTQYILLDALGKGIEFEMVPRNNLNKIGFLIDEERWGWMNIDPKKGLDRYVFGRIKLEEDSSIDAELTILYKGYSAAIQRNAYSEMKDQPEKYIRENVFKNFPDLELEEFEIDNEEVSDQPFLVKIKFKTDNFLRKESEYMFLEPLMMRMIEENPFKNDARKFPVDFACPISEKYIITILIPEGYETLQVPHSLYAVLPDEAGSFKYDSQQVDRHLQLISHIEINKTDFPLSVYPDIQAFFAYVVEKHDEDIILKRILE